MADQKQPKPSAEDVASSTGSDASQKVINERADRLVAAGEAVDVPSGRYIAISPVDHFVTGDRDDFAHLNDVQIKRLVDLGVIAEPKKLKRAQVEQLQAAGIRGEWDEE